MDDSIRKLLFHSRKVNYQIITSHSDMVFKPAYATFCVRCGKDWEREFINIQGTDNRDLNYCPVCGEELSTK